MPMPDAIRSVQKAGAMLLITFALGACSSEGPAQTEACEAYVSCLQARDARLGVQTNADRFEAGGACWGSEDGAHLCDTACSRGLEFLASHDPAPECQP